MARPTPPGKRTRISVLDAVVVIVVVIGGVLAIIRYNWLAISRLAHSLPNVNSQIVGEWKSTRGPEHLVFRTDKTVSMTVAANLAQDSAAPAAPETGSFHPIIDGIFRKEPAKVLRVERDQMIIRRPRKLKIRSDMRRIPGWGTWIRTRIDGVRWGIRPVGLPFVGLKGAALQVDGRYWCLFSSRKHHGRSAA